MNADVVNEILNIKESYKMPETLQEILLDQNKKEKIFDEFLEVGEPLDHDWFTGYFQTEHGDKKRLKQDYTPDCLCELVAKVSELDGTVADICAGTGGLTLKAWQHGVKEFYCVEFAERVIPILLMNLSIRNIKATVIQGDALKKQTTQAYKLTPGEKYSDIATISDLESVQDFKVDAVIMNPPYSMKWDGNRCFFGYETPPKSKCDYAFVLDGMEKLKENGMLTAILPHGILFRGSREEAVRKRLIEQNYLDLVIGMPDKLFLDTDIPVAIIKWQKGKKSDDVLFIDSSKEFKREGKKNIMEEKHIQKVLSAYTLRKDIDKFAYVTNFEEIQRNNFNLNIPRYVDTYEPPEPIDIVKATKDLYDIEKRIRGLNHSIRLSVEELTAETKEKKEEVKKVQEYWRWLDEL